MNGPIAIVGLGCRYPGGVRDAATLWDALQRDDDVLGEVPAGRWDARALYDPDPEAPGRVYTTRGGFLDDVEGMDAAFFGLSAREAERLDPQQRLLLEVGFEAMEDAGLDPNAQRGAKTGVFVGISHSDYWEQLAGAGDRDGASGYALTGNELALASGRLAYQWGFTGPAVSIATACSSSLVAVHQAIRALRAGECDRALAGGVNVMLGAAVTQYLCRLGALAPDGRCKVFDAAADGYVRSEGCGLVVLERLDDARKAGRRILAVLRGSAVNQDGRTNGLTAPNGDAQEAVIRAALADAGLAPDAVDFVEAHGTGTTLGDPIELHALGAALGTRAEPVRVGSVKSRLGHAESAAGIAGLLAAVAALRHGTVPRTLHFRTPNPLVAWDRLPVEVLAQPWALPDRGRARVAGVSSFGFSGTNAHVLVEEAPVAAAGLRRAAKGPWMLPISAATGPALVARATQLADRVEAANLEPADVVASLARRARHDVRGAVVAADRASLVSGLRAVTPAPAPLAGHPHPGAARGKLAFLYTGQGSPYPGMGRGLYDTFPVYRDALEEADVALSPHLDGPVVDLLLHERDAARLEDTANAQPALFALEYALTKLWASWGVRPDAVMGHSLGELVAACVAGVMTLDDAAELVAVRGRSMGALPPGGAMASVRAGEAVVAAAVAAVGGDVGIAGLNGPDQTVISGAAEAVAAVTRRLEREGVASVPLHVSHAFHSPLVAPAVAELRATAERLRFATPRLPLVTNLTGDVADRVDADHWARHVLAPVRFLEGARTLERLGVTTWVEIGPHPVLAGMAARCVKGGKFVPSLFRGRDDAKTALDALAAVFAEGRDVEPPGRGQLVDLPPYPFQRARHWIEGVATAPAPKAEAVERVFETRWVAATPGSPREGDVIVEAGELLDLADTLKGLTAEKRRVVVVTRGGDDDPDAAAAWGLVRSWRSTRPPGRTVLVDTDGSDVAAALATGEDELRVRAGVVTAPRWTPVELPRVDVTLPDGPILVTGGLGALGLAVAKWLVDNGARHLVLLGRRPPAEPVRIGDARVDVVQADVADRDQLARAIAGRGIRGVIHAAGVATETPLATIDRAAFAAVLAPKIAGTRNLDALLPDAELFVVFSSIAATIGSPDGAYAAANAWLDAFARRCRAAGRPALSVAWGLWSGEGMAAHLDAGARTRLARIGFGLLDPARALQRLGDALSGPPAIVVAPVDGRRLSTLAEPSSPLRGLVVGQRAAVTTPGERLTGDALRARVRAVVAEVLGRDPEDVPADRPLADLGLDSLLAVDIRDRLAAIVGRPLPAPLAFDHPTVDALARYLDAPDPVLADAPRVTTDQPIAVIGVGCRFPGGVVDATSYWRLLLDGVDTVGPIPASRWDADAWYDPDPDAPGRTYVRQGAFVDGVEDFDARFFGVSPREARQMDPQQRLLLEVAWEALEDAGIAADRLAGSRTGVFVGICSDGYDAHTATDEIDPYTGTGNAHSVAAGRVSYTLDLSGPSVAVDTACSSSLVAVHQACMALRSDECGLALAGGVNLVLSPEATITLSKLRVLSPTGACRTFGAGADGYVRGEGCGVLVLKRLADARRDGDEVLAVIRGTAVNHDGRSQGLAAPSGPAQQRVVRAALAQAGIEPASVGYVECHGTGTALGDPIEVEALAASLGAGRDTPLLIGAVKSNIGHAEGAAGVAGLIKAVLTVRSGVVPPTLHADEPNPRVPWAELPLRIATRRTEWTGARPRVAGVSSFGFGGTNAHVVVQEAPPVARPEAPERPQVLLLSARTESALATMATNLAAHLDAHPELRLADVAHTLHVGRARFPNRVALPAASLSEAIHGLRAFAAGVLVPGAARGEASERPGHATGDVARDWVRGIEADAPAGRRVRLPTYPFERVRHWGESTSHTPEAAAGRPASAHPMLGVAFTSATRRGERAWEQSTDAPGLRFLRDHTIEDAVIVPGAAWLEMAAAAVREQHPDGVAELADVRFERPLALDAPRVFQLALGADHAFVVASRPREGDAWTTHARGHARPAPAAERARVDLDAIRARLPAHDVDALYAALDAHDFHYGPVFRAIKALWAEGDEVLAQLAAPGADRFGVHPAMLDASFQALAAVVKLDGDKPAVPMGVRRLRLHGRAGAPAWAHVRRTTGDGIGADLVITDADGVTCVEIEGLRVAPLERERPTAGDDLWFGVTWEEKPAAAGPVGRWSVDDPAIARAIVEAGGEVGPSPRVVVTGDWRTALAAAKGLLGRADARLVIVTRGAVPPGEIDPYASMLWGFGRSLAIEHPELDVRLVDADGTEGLAAALAAADDEDQVALRGGKRFVARLVPQPPKAGVTAPVGDRAWRVEVGAVGQLDRLGLVEAARRAPGPGEVEIAVEGAGINFIDVLSALGALGDAIPKLVVGDADAGLGAECAGTVVRVGEGVALRPGDRVLAAASGCLARYVTTDATMVVPLPDGLSTVDAATLPIAYATVLQGLKHVARLERGERVLIHSGTGGVGLAAIAYARHVGAEIFATAGSESKRAHLRALGIEHVSDSRSLRFVEDVRAWTGGEGVDVVLNSLAGPLLAAGVDLLRDHGRFVELGKRDVLENAGLGLRPFLRNLSFTLVDLVGMMKKRPAKVRALLEEVLDLVARGVLPPLPHREAPADEVETLFREMAAARHVGKLVVTPARTDAPLRVTPPRPRKDGAYLVTGGLGGLGRTVALHLARQGAGKLVLLGRSAPSEDAKRDIEAMRAAGAIVEIASVDVADCYALASVLPADLRGVVHAAGVLGEEPLRTLTPEAFEDVIAAKVNGAWNLHALTKGRPLDFFLLFGSVSAVLGAPGQAHYAAGNAFLDGLAHLRRREGLVATSLAWGPIARVGMAAREDIEARFARMGIRYLSPETMLAAIDRALAGDVTQASLFALAPGGGGLAAQAKPFLGALSQAAGGDAGIRAALREVDGAERRERLEAWLREQIAGVLGAKPGDVRTTASFAELGLDSLMALELRNRIQRDLGLQLSATVALSYDSVARLGEHLAPRLEGDAPAEPVEVVKVADLPALATLDDAIRPAWSGAPLVPARRALVTGGTGFVGAYVVAELLARGVDVTCVARGKPGRVRAALDGYGLWRPEFEGRLDVLPGDLGKPGLGLDEATFDRLADTVDLVVHAGATVNWMAPYRALEPVNVGGTREVLRLCCAGRPKVLHDVSTLGTIGVYDALGRTPPGVDPGARLPRLLHANGYFQTKWVAEQLVIEARRRGLPASIWRPGLVTGDSRTGADSATAGQFFFSLLKGCIQMGVAPAWGGQLRVVPVDYVARAIATVALRPDGQDVDVNLTNRRPLGFEGLVDALREEGWFLLTEAYPRWHADVVSLPRTAPDNALAPFAAFLAGVPPDERIALDWFGAVDALDDAKARDLLGAAEVRCPPFDAALLRTYTRWYVETGALAPPAQAGEGEEAGVL